MSQPARIALALAVAASTLLSACIVVPAGRPAYAGEVVMAAPPPPQAEVVGVAPAVGYVWIGGFWNWVGGRHVWIGGHWEAPRPGHVWVPHQWMRYGNGWRMAPGHWERR
jgi:hypothetical protein